MVARGSVGAVLPSVTSDEPDPDVTLHEFFGPDFMAEYTSFDSFDAFVAASPWSIEDGDDLDRVPSAELDRYVRRTTEFDGWVAMRNRAAGREVRERLLL